MSNQPHQEAKLISITVHATYRCPACGRYGREELTGVIDDRVAFQCNLCQAAIYIDLAQKTEEGK